MCKPDPDPNIIVLPKSYIHLFWVWGYLVIGLNISPAAVNLTLSAAAYPASQILNLSPLLLGEATARSLTLNPESQIRSGSLTCYLSKKYYWPVRLAELEWHYFNGDLAENQKLCM